MRPLRLALRLASTRGAEALAAMASLALGAGSLAAAFNLYRGGSLVLRADGALETGPERVFVAFALATGLAASLSFALIMRCRMTRRLEAYDMLRAIGATSLSIFATLMAETLFLALGGAILSIVVSLPLYAFADASLANLSFPALAARASTQNPQAGFLAWTGLRFALILASFAAIPALQTTWRCARKIVDIA